MRLLILLTTLFLSNTPAFAFSIDEAVQNCRIQNDCNALALSPGAKNLKDLLSQNDCFHDKVASCYWATAWAGIHETKNDADLTRTILYGNFCGWRNLAKNKDGSPLDWNKNNEVTQAMEDTPAIDEIDAACKWHDFQYFKDNYDICGADADFIRRMEVIAFSQKLNLSPQKREMALALAGAILRNHSTCGALRFLKKIRVVR